MDIVWVIGAPHIVPTDGTRSQYDMDNAIPPVGRAHLATLTCDMAIPLGLRFFQLILSEWPSLTSHSDGVHVNRG